MNLSTRGYVGTGAQRLIGGFRVYGDQLEVLVRGFGPSRNNEDNLDDAINLENKPLPYYQVPSGIVSEVDDATGNTRLSGVNH